MYLELSIFLFFISLSNFININFFKDKYFYSKLNLSLTLTLIFLITFFFFIIYSFCIYDFSIMTIFLTSNIYLPLIYKIGAFWSTHDGSIILWNLILWVYLLTYCLILNKNANLKFFKIFNFNIFIFYLIIIFFFYYAFFSNIFIKVNFYLISKTLITLNPILQDISLLFHPICLYVGYIGLIMPCIILFSYNSKILNNFYVYNLYSKYKLFTWWILTIGLFLGSWWAYYELGWGGWWFWDPVENIALIPWGIIILLIHIMIIHKRNSNFETSLLSLVAFNFFFSIIGTFLVRSGLFNSVHSFADLSNQKYYIFLSLIIILCYIIYFLNIKNKQLFYYKSKSQESLFIWMLIIMFLINFIIIFGTFLPFILSAFRQVSVGAHFFESLIILFIIPLIMFMLYFYNKRYNIFYKNKEFFFAFSILLIFFNIIPLNFYNFIIILALIIIIMNLLIKSDWFMKGSHIIFAFFIICVLINSLFEENNLYYLIPGDHYTFSNFIVYYTNLFRSYSQDHLSVISEFLILDDNKNFFTYFYPEQRFFSNNMFVFKSAINSNLLGDVSIFLTKTEEQGSWAIRFKYSPLINGIWLSFILLILNIFIKLKNKNNSLNYWK